MIYEKYYSNKNFYEFQILIDLLISFFVQNTTVNALCCIPGLTTDKPSGRLRISNWSEGIVSNRTWENSRNVFFLDNFKLGQPMFGLEIITTTQDEFTVGVLNFENSERVIRIISRTDLTDTGEDSKLVHRRKRPKVDTLYSSLFSDASERRVWVILYDSPPSRKYSRPLLDVFACIGQSN